MKKVLCLVMAVMIFASIGLAGCTKSEPAKEEPKVETQQKEEPKQEQKAEESAKPVTLNITWWGSQTRHDYTAKLLEMYSAKYPNVKFESSPSGWSGYFDKLSAQAAGGLMPDIIQMDYGYISTFTKNDTLLDLSPLVDAKVLDLSNVDENLVASGNIDGKLTGAVLSSAALALTYNPELFKEAGVTEPTSDWKWSDFEKSLLTITEKTGKYGIGKFEIYNYLPYFARQNGESLFSADGTKLGYQDDKVMVDFIKLVMELQSAKSIPSPDEWMQISSKGKEAEPVVTGEGASTFDWSNFAVIVSSINPDLKLMTPPYGDSGKKALWVKPGMFFSVAKSSKASEEAAKFINWFINDEEANKVIMAERGVPVSSKIREALKPSLNEQQKAMFDYIDLAISHSTKIDPPEPAGYAEVKKIMIDSLNLVLYNKATPEEAAAEFRKKANEVLSRVNK